MTLNHVQRGESMRIPASDWNKIVDSTRAFFERQTSGNGGPATSGNKQASVILVKNNSGFDQERFAVLGIDAPIILPGAGGHLDEFKRQVALSCVVPVEADHKDKFVILLEPLASGAIGRACVAGVCAVQVEVVNEFDTHAAITDNDATKMTSGSSGGSGAAIVLWKEPGTGLLWAIVKLGGGTSKPFWAKLGAATSIGSNRWSYPFTEQVYQTSGTFKNKPVGGRSGTAYNSVETNNNVTGIQGNGVDAGNLPSGVGLQPIGAGAVVLIHEVANCNTGVIEYIFEAVNQVDGACEV